MSSVSVLLVYETPGGSPLTIARVADSRVITDVANAAVRAIESRADALAEADVILGEVERAEAGKLKKILSLLVPDLKLREDRVRSTVM